MSVLEKSFLACWPVKGRSVAETIFLPSSTMRILILSQHGSPAKKSREEVFDVLERN